MRFAPLLFVAAMLAASPLMAADIEKGIIREGVGVAGVRLGMSVAEVRRKLGAPLYQNATPDGRAVFMSFHETENFGVYVDEADQTIELLIVSVESGGFCTRYKACLYKEGDLSKIKAKHRDKLLRFVDRDGSITYRLPGVWKGRKTMTEYTPVEERDGVVQVAISWWDGPIDASSLD